MNIEYELVKRLYRKQTIDKYIKKSIYLNENKDNVYSFLIIRLFLSILVFFLAFIFLGRYLFLSLAITFIFGYLYTYFKYDIKIYKQEKVYEKEASLFFEVLLISLKSGNNLLKAFLLSIKNVDNSFSKQMEKVLSETKYGRSFHEALLDYKDKIYSNSIKSIIISLTETYISGKGMIDNLEKEIDLLNEKRINEIKTYINKLPIKISVISVFILIPLMLLLVLSPVILEYFS